MTRVMGFSQEGGASSSSQEPDHFRIVLITLGKSLLLPALLVIFFQFAPAWLDYKLHNQITEAINQDRKLSPSEKSGQIANLNHIHLRDYLHQNPAGHERLQHWLEDSGILAQFQRLEWGQYLSWALAGLLLASISATCFYNSRAGRSPEDLTSNFRQSWRMVMITALIKVVLLVPLLGYGVFEFSVLLSDHYFPKLILIIVAGGLYAIWKCGSILLSNVPLEFTENMARSVSEEEAPELWRVVRTAADRLQTAAPTNILIGMDLNFYVTELAVLHDGGRAEGRTLYLSYPALKLLPPEEVTAIIGHELGHFIGNDTQMTREFYPLRNKVHRTLVTLAGASWAAWPSFQFLCFFLNCFEKTVQTASRQRELLADQVGANLTSPETQARALLRFHILVEAFQLGVSENVRQNANDPMNVSVHSIVQQKLLNESKFWTALAEQKLPHPLDSHPPLHERINHLGYQFDIEVAKAIALEETDCAYNHWLAKEEHLFGAITDKVQVALKRAQVQQRATEATLSSDEGRQLLANHFPPVSWSIRSFSFCLAVGVWMVAAAVLLTILLIVGEAKLYLFLGLPLIALVLISVVQWKAHRHGTLTLDATGLAYSGWQRPLLFEDVAKVSFQEVNGNLTLVAKLKQSRTSLWKFRPQFFRVSTVSISLTMFDAKDLTIAQTILRYYTRELEAVTTEAS